MTRYINEASAMTVRARFFNESGDLTAPASIRYRVRDISNDRIVVDWTSVDPDTQVDITLPASVNNLYQDGRRRRTEKRVLVVQTNNGQDSQLSEEIAYVIRDLFGFES